MQKNYTENNTTLPFISAVIPTRNEEKFIRKCLESLIASDYPKELLEIIAVDGMSTDSTREIIQEFCVRYPFVSFLDNPHKILAAGWNEGIKHAKGSIIFTLNGHGIFASGYFKQCILTFEKYPNASNVGGIVRAIPIKETFVGKGIASALSHPFGVGNSYLRIGTDQERYADTAAFGGYKRSVFDTIGLFNENLTRSQDMEFHVRMKKANLKILITPKMHCDYYTRSGIMEYTRFNFWNGFWTTFPLSISPMAFSLRHFTPLFFVLSLFCMALLSIASRSIVPFIVLASLYVTASLLATLHALVTRKHPSNVLLPLLFPLLHVGYGLGSFAGCIQGAKSKSFWHNIIHVFHNQA